MTTPAPPDDWFLPDEDAVLQMRRVRVRRGTDPDPLFGLVASVLMFWPGTTAWLAQPRRH